MPEHEGYDCVLCGHGSHEDGECNENMKTSWPPMICDCPRYVPDA